MSHNSCAFPDLGRSNTARLQHSLLTPDRQSKYCNCKAASFTVQKHPKRSASTLPQSIAASERASSGRSSPSCRADPPDPDTNTGYAARLLSCVAKTKKAARLLPRITSAGGDVKLLRLLVEVQKKVRGRKALLSSSLPPVLWFPSSADSSATLRFW